MKQRKGANKMTIANTILEQLGGDTVAILEAMKMENAIHAGRDGVVKSIEANAGDAVLEGAVIITLD